MPVEYNQKNKKIFQKKGFSIIELIVAIAIFSLVISSMVGMFVAAIRSQSKILAVQKLLDETSYSIEYMSRYIRMAVRDDNGICIQEPPPACDPTPALKYNYYNPLPAGLSNIRFIDYGGQKCHQFGLKTIGLNQALVEWRADLAIPPDDPPACTGIDNSPLSFTSLTSKNIYLRSINFKLAGETRKNDVKQPRVTILMEVGKGATEQPGFFIQTTISQRNLDL